MAAGLSKRPIFRGFPWLRAFFTFGLLSFAVGSSFAATVGTCDWPTEAPLISTQDEANVRCLGDCTSLDPSEPSVRLLLPAKSPLLPIGPRCLYAGPECKGIPLQSNAGWDWRIVTWIPTPDLIASRRTTLSPKTGTPWYKPIHSQWQPSTVSPPPRR